MTAYPKLNAGQSGGFAALYAEKLCFSQRSNKLFAALPPEAKPQTKGGQAVPVKPSFTANRRAKPGINGHRPRRGRWL